VKGRAKAGNGMAIFINENSQISASVISCMNKNLGDYFEINKIEF
jgi:hypothetical protein